jgi:MerR family transcriptional regulator, mercuric resistance operon regulatory protein
MDGVGRPLTIGVLAKTTGCQAETIRFYEHVGLLPAPRRSPGGYRLYGDGHVTRLTFVRRAREVGFSLAEVRTMLRLADERARPCAEVRVVASTHLRAVRARIADLQAMERVLRATVARCARGTGSDCPLLDTLSGARGSDGPSAASPRRAPALLDDVRRDGPRCLTGSAGRRNVRR